MNAKELAAFWDRAIDEFLDSGRAVPAGLEEWFSSYGGVDRGQPQSDALPEPWLGNLQNVRRAVFLQLNPGKATPRQRGDSLFVRQVRAMGGYSRWAELPPYWTDNDADDDSGQSAADESARFWKYSKQFSRVRLRFARDWFQDPTIAYKDIAMFELYPWHSDRITRVLKPPLRFVQEFISEPIADLGASIVFAFGKPWFHLLDELGIKLQEPTGASWLVPTRKVAFARLPKSGIWVVAEKHRGGAGPPRADEVPRIREAFTKLTASGRFHE